MKLPIRVSEESREPIYHQIEEQIKALIVGGQLTPGTPLPSIRALANELSCSVITTRRAYQNLELAGYIKTAQGKRTFVRELKEATKEEAKRKVLYGAFKKAIDQGEQLGYTNGEMYSLIKEIFKENE
jgi:GntR family transcriptional regulator